MPAVRMSTASTMILQKYPGRTPDMTAVSLGYDRVRFLKPVFINDTITVHYEIEAVDDNKNRSLSKSEIISTPITMEGASIRAITATI